MPPRLCLPKTSGACLLSWRKNLTSGLLLQTELDHDPALHLNCLAVLEVRLKLPGPNRLHRRLNEYGPTGDGPQPFHAALGPNQRSQLDPSSDSPDARRFWIDRFHFRDNPFLHGLGRNSQRFSSWRFVFQFIPRSLPLPPSQSAESEHQSDQDINCASSNVNSGLSRGRRLPRGRGRFVWRGSDALFFSKVFFLEIFEIRRLCRGAVNPIPDHLFLLRRQANKLEPATETRLITNKGARSNRYAYVRKPQLNRHLLACGHFSRDHRAHTHFTDVGAAPR